MPNRREFMLQTAAVSGALALTGARAASAGSAAPAAEKALRILILGGTGFIGPHFVHAAMGRGHKVSVLVFRGSKKTADLPADVEPLMGDRNGDLESIRNRDWDAVLDLAAYAPNWVRTLGEALQGRAKHYTYISSIMAYQFPGASDERSKLAVYAGSQDPYSFSMNEPGEHYGPLKVLCEREAERQFPGKTLILRPGHIVGPREKIGAFTYLVARLDKGGEVLAAGDPLTQVQLIDVRDLAEWTIHLVESGQTGAFTATGPAMPISWSELLGGIRATFSIPMKLTWIPVPWLMERKVDWFSSLLFWPSQFGIPGFTELKVDKAVANGLTFRPLSTTVADTLAWYKSQPVERQRAALIQFSGTSIALEDSMAREAEMLAAWQAEKRK